MGLWRLFSQVAHQPPRIARAGGSCNAPGLAEDFWNVPRGPKFSLASGPWHGWKFRSVSGLVFGFLLNYTRAREVHKGYTKGKTDIWQQVWQRIQMPRMTICTQTVAWNLVLSLYFIPLAPIFYTSMHRRSRLEDPQMSDLLPPSLPLSLHLPLSNHIFDASTPVSTGAFWGCIQADKVYYFNICQPGRTFIVSRSLLWRPWCRCLPVAHLHRCCWLILLRCFEIANSYVSSTTNSSTCASDEVVAHI